MLNPKNRYPVKYAQVYFPLQKLCEIHVIHRRRTHKNARTILDGKLKKVLHSWLLHRIWEQTTRDENNVYVHGQCSLGETRFG